MDSTTIKAFAICGALLLLYGVIAIVKSNNAKKYMKEQMETGRDKNRMLAFMQQVMQGKYGNYTYAVASHVKAESTGKRVIYYYFPYIVAFNETEMLIVSYIVKEGQILCRNVLPVDFDQTKMTYKSTKKGIHLNFEVGSESIPMDVDKVVKSNGAEKTDTPLGIYQEAEVDRLISLLPNYPKRG